MMEHIPYRRITPFYPRYKNCHLRVKFEVTREGDLLLGEDYEESLGTFFRKTVSTRNASP